MNYLALLLTVAVGCSESNANYDASYAV